MINSGNFMRSCKIPYIISPHQLDARPLLLTHDRNNHVIDGATSWKLLKVTLTNGDEYICFEDGAMKHRSVEDLSVAEYPSNTSIDRADPITFDELKPLINNHQNLAGILNSYSIMTPVDVAKTLNNDPAMANDFYFLDFKQLQLLEADDNGDAVFVNPKKSGIFIEIPVKPDSMKIMDYYRTIRNVSFANQLLAEGETNNIAHDQGFDSIRDLSISLFNNPDIDVLNQSVESVKDLFRKSSIKYSYHIPTLYRAAKFIYNWKDFKKTYFLSTTVSKDDIRDWIVDGWIEIGASAKSFHAGYEAGELPDILDIKFADPKGDHLKIKGTPNPFRRPPSPMIAPRQKIVSAPKTNQNQGTQQVLNDLGITEAGGYEMNDNEAYGDFFKRILNDLHIGDKKEFSNTISDSIVEEAQYAGFNPVQCSKKFKEMCALNNFPPIQTAMILIRIYLTRGTNIDKMTQKMSATGRDKTTKLFKRLKVKANNQQAGLYTLSHISMTFMPLTVKAVLDFKPENNIWDCTWNNPGDLFALPGFACLIPRKDEFNYMIDFCVYFNTEMSKKIVKRNQFYQPIGFNNDPGLNAIRLARAATHVDDDDRVKALKNFGIINDDGKIKKSVIDHLKKKFPNMNNVDDKLVYDDTI